MFKEVVKTMKPSEIVMAMVNGLKNVHYEIDMDVFGAYRHGVCYGCAATNTIYEISQKKFTSNNIEDRKLRANFLECDVDFLNYFENAVDSLRRGNVRNFLHFLKNIIDLNIDKTIILISNIESDLKKPLERLIELDSDDYKNFLHKYENFAKMLEKHNY